MQLPPYYSPDSASLYLHIPFCRKACHYCNFHFSTQTSYQDEMIRAMIAELALRKDELKNKSITTIYFGGGTPSVMTADQLTRLLNSIHLHYSVATDVEITFEANPDDLSRDYLSMLNQTGVNRLSIGLQSFHEKELTWMNRSHSADQSIAILDVLESDFAFDYSADLIFGIPGSTIQDWEDNLTTLAKYRAPHISCYNLTVEPGTPLHHHTQSGKNIPLTDEVQSRLYILTHQFLTSNNYDHYEISNYAQDGKHSKHNTGYWFGNHYVGIGPGAHSYNGTSRSWNVANNALYLTSIREKQLPQEQETLSKSNQYNERIMVGLRTKWGVDTKTLNLSTAQAEFIKELSAKKLATTSNNRIILTEEGQLQSDSISAQLFLEE